MKLSPNNYKLYIHTNKINGKKYVGITKQKPERRWQGGRGYAGTYFGNAILKYGWDNFTHDVIMDGLTKDEACYLEKKTIASLRTTDKRFGYNVSEGGQVCDRINVKRGIEHHHHTRVKMIDPITGTVLRIFDTQNEAATIMAIGRKGITKACMGVLETYKGYVWEYADKEYNKPVHNGAGNYNHSKIQKPVYAVDNNGGVMRYNSVKEAAADLGIRSSNISRYLNGTRKDPERRWYYGF